jgi:hypothetical protein
MFTMADFVDYLRANPPPLDSHQPAPTSAAVSPSPRALVLLDGHSSRFSPTVWEECAKKGIDVLCIPPHSSHIVQPLDKFVNATWKAELKKMGKPPGKRQFNTLLLPFFFDLSVAIYRAMDPAIIISSFAAAGIFPFNPPLVLDPLPPTWIPPPSLQRQAQPRNIYTLGSKLLTHPTIIQEMLSRQKPTSAGPPPLTEPEEDDPLVRLPQTKLPRKCSKVLVYEGVEKEEDTSTPAKSTTAPALQPSPCSTPTSPPAATHRSTAAPKSKRVQTIAPQTAQRSSRQRRKPVVPSDEGYAFNESDSEGSGSSRRTHPHTKKRLRLEST